MVSIYQRMSDIIGETLATTLRPAPGKYAHLYNGAKKRPGGFSREPFITRWESGSNETRSGEVDEEVRTGSGRRPANRAPDEPADADPSWRSGRDSPAWPACRAAGSRYRESYRVNIESRSSPGRRHSGISSLRDGRRPIWGRRPAVGGGRLWRRRRAPGRGRRRLRLRETPAMEGDCPGHWAGLGGRSLAKNCTEMHDQSIRQNWWAKSAAWMGECRRMVVINDTWIESFLYSYQRCNRFYPKRKNLSDDGCIYICVLVLPPIYVRTY